MDFVRLRLSGFKSFVDPAEFRIEPGLTGVVGPNGCGKSNLLEALRWVMGAASAKAMRGEGMDDVIFAGSTARPSRNHAEVTLTIDNADGHAPASFRAEPVLEVSRRIERGEGSTYRVNGREVRARDVQILFADASTGANSPALVRQGQISELIAAKPQNRRRILEEAAGVTGLHGRRHEAELRVAAAASNLERLDDLARELDSNLARLRREGRQAARYKALAAEIRALQASVLQSRWFEARALVERVSIQAAEAEREREAALRAAAVARTQAMNAEAAIKPLRDEAMAATAALGALAIEKDRLDRDLEAARAEVARLTADLERLADDDAREAAWLADAAAALARLDADGDELRRLLEAAPERGPALEEAARFAEEVRTNADTAVETLAARLAAAEAEARSADERVVEAEAHAARLKLALDEARSELTSLASSVDAALDEAAETASRATKALALARVEVGEAEADRGRVHAAEALARMKRRLAEDTLAGAMTEAQALARLTADGPGRRFAPALDSVAAHSGFEAALAAALGDDLDAALDSRAPAFWAGAGAVPPAWPDGATPLGERLEAPPQLAARLAFTALVEAADGPRLQAHLPPGARLVSREGDLWRWDGLTVRASAPRPAQTRLEQKTRRAALEAALTNLSPAAEAAKAAHAEATSAVEAAETRLRSARTAQGTAETALVHAQQGLESRRQDAAGREARVRRLTDTVERLEREAAEAVQAVSLRAAEQLERRIDTGLQDGLKAARDEAGAARDEASRAKLALDAEVRERDARGRRLSSLISERADWATRMQSTQRRRENLAGARETTTVLLEAARAAPARTEARRGRILDDFVGAEARKAKTADDLALAEAARGEADRDARAADGRAADAREARASLDARLSAAHERLAEHAEALAGASDHGVAELEARFGAEIVGDIQSGAGEARLSGLERERDAIGPVNLRAEEEATDLATRVAELSAERSDLAGALAKLRLGIGELNAEGRTRLLAAFEIIHGHFRDLFVTLFQGGQAELRLVESDDPLEAGLEILACPPGKRMAVMSLMSGGEQALTAMALIFAVFLANPAPVCVLDEADAPLDDANVERFCNLLAAIRARASTRFIVISHNALTMSRMDRLYGVTMREPGVSQLVSVDLRTAEAMAAT